MTRVKRFRCECGSSYKLIIRTGKCACKGCQMNLCLTDQGNGIIHSKGATEPLIEVDGLPEDQSGGYDEVNA
jgi:hypothetical protein